jgi:poly(A) polymerase
LDFQTFKKLPALQLAYQISQELGASAYLVGGAVRDALIGFFYGKDFDFVLGEQWQEAARLLALKAHGTVIPWDCNQIRIVVREAGSTVTIDFAGFRGADIISDLQERDFTINSMALSVASLFQDASPVIYDPLGGRRHLHEKMLKADGAASFDQDPLRILRAIRFSRALNFRIEDKTQSMMQEKAHLLTGVARERVKREFFAILSLPGAEHAIKELAAYHIMHHLLPELQLGLLPCSWQTVACLVSMLDHPESIEKNYAAAIQDYLSEYVEEGIISRRALLMCAGLLHDSAKSIDPESSGLLRPGRESVSFNQKITQSLLLGRKARRILDTITHYHMRIHHLAELEEKNEQALRRFLHDTAEAPLETVLLALADMQAAGVEKRLPKAADRVMRLAEKIVVLLFSGSSGDRYQPLISGEDVMNVMNLNPGEAVGKIVREIHDGERDGRFNSRDEVLEWLKKRKQSESD